MANFEIPDKDAIASVDRAADALLIYDDSANALKKTTVNTLLDLTSHPVGLTDTQTLTNKTLTQPVITADDDEFTLQDNADTTKKLNFQLSGITTATTRTLTVPDASTTLVGTDATQTLTNKTLTSPTINTATISNPTLTTDTVSEHTSANGVTVDGLNIKDGKLNTANSVDSANYTDGSIDPEHLITGSGTSWVWQSWVPTWANFTVGNGTVAASYTIIGKSVLFSIKVELGSTSAVSGDVTFTLPVTAKNSDTSWSLNGDAILVDAGTQQYKGTVYTASSTTVATVRVLNAASTHITFGTAAGALSSTVPFTWTTGDKMSISGQYEAA